MTEFIFLFLYRVLAGAHNSLGYEKQWRMMYNVETLLCLMALAGVWIFPNLHAPHWTVIPTAFMLGLAFMAILAVGDSFDERYNIVPADVHFYEMGKTGLVILAWMLGNGDLIGICASVYPGLIIHKGLINLGTNQSFFYYGTDDASGRTFSIPILGIKVRRAPQWMRFVLAGISIVGLILAMKWKIEVRLFDLLAFLK